MCTGARNTCCHTHTYTHRALLSNCCFMLSFTFNDLSLTPIRPINLLSNRDRDLKIHTIPNTQTNTHTQLPYYRINSISIPPCDSPIFLNRKHTHKDIHENTRCMKTCRKIMQAKMCIILQIWWSNSSIIYRWWNHLWAPASAPFKAIQSRPE